MSRTSRAMTVALGFVIAIAVAAVWAWQMKKDEELARMIANSGWEAMSGWQRYYNVGKEGTIILPNAMATSGVYLFPHATSVTSSAWIDSSVPYRMVCRPQSDGTLDCEATR